MKYINGICYHETECGDSDVALCYCGREIACTETGVVLVWDPDHREAIQAFADKYDLPVVWDM